MAAKRLPINKMNLTWRIAIYITLFLGGCSERGPVMYPVSGEVHFENMPITKGDIVFEPLDHALTAAGCKIENGRFTGRVSPGKNRIRITATRPRSEIDPHMGKAPEEQFIPAQYNSDSTLEVDISATSSNVLPRFDLK